MIDEDMMLNKVQRLIELDRSLTKAIENADPWLPGGSARPLPTSMDDVYKILCIGRNLASRTSAPVGWNPQAPVLGFTTPNPMPHQLRGGSLGALQLEMARKQLKMAKEEQMERKREREEAKRKEDEIQNKDAKRPILPQRQASAARPVQVNRPRQAVIVADMNLSDSSSDEDESDDE
jgi:Vitamin-D-receptor interacting Mediator subunit 4